MNNKEAQFLTLLKEHKRIIFKLCRGYTDNEEEFKDLTQEVYYQMYKSLDKFEGRSKSSTWIYKLTLNVCISHYGGRKKSQRGTTDREVIHALYYDSEIIDDGRPEQLVNLYKAIGSLKPIERAIVMLYLEGHSQKSISVIVGMSQSNVGVKLHRIKRKLKAMINGRS